MKEYIVSQEYIDGIYTDEGSTFGLDMQKELIRCKDCKTKPRCLMYRYNKDLYGFCKWAERKKNEDIYGQKFSGRTGTQGTGKGRRRIQTQRVV